MGIGIMVCGLNGSGKSTIGKALADKLGFHFIDNEQLFFSRFSNDEPYINPRSHDEAINILMNEVHANPNFVFAAVKGDYGREIVPLYTHIVLIEVPKNIRMQRIRNRSYSKFGERMMAGGDLYEQEEQFFNFVEARSEDCSHNWAQTLSRPILKIDGTKPIEENVSLILNSLSL